MKRIFIAGAIFSVLVSPSLSHAASKAHRHSVATHQKKSYALKTSTHARTRQHARLVQMRKQQAAELGANYDGKSALQLASTKALIVNQTTGEVIYAKNTNLPTPIASITKLMTAMVTLDAKLPLDESIAVTDEDIDYLKGSSSRLPVGSVLSRGDMLHVALMASENRAASSLGRNYPGGLSAFVRAMNAKAQSLGMTNTHFADPTGLESQNVSTAEDLVKMVQAAYQYPEIRQATTSPEHEVYISDREYPTNFRNTNGLVRKGEWEIGLSKTGYINEAGRCLVMQAKIAGEPMILVLLDSNGKLTRIGDANRVRKWMEYNNSTTTGEVNTEDIAPARSRKVS